MKLVYSKVNGRLLHIFYVCPTEFTGRVDITNPEEFLQVGLMSYDKQFKAHKHVVKEQNVKEFQVQEAFIVIDGTIDVTVYDVDDTPICIETIERGGLALLISGGHSIDAHGVFYEVKTGPYEGQAKDKVWIDTSYDKSVPIE